VPFIILRIFFDNQKLVAEVLNQVNQCIDSLESFAQPTINEECSFGSKIKFEAFLDLRQIK
jgi:hypothetical protein